MDFSRLHTYTPPQCLPENTGYTYALSSSYSSDALDFETEHKLNPVFDSPRMSRRRLHVVTTAHAAEGGRAGDAASCISNTVSLRDSLSRTATQHRGARRTALSITQASRKGPAGRRGSSGPQGAACVRPPVLDESLIREQTRVDHFWGLDDDGDVKGGSTAASEGSGNSAVEVAKANGYTCADCSALSEHKGMLTACPTPRGTVSRLYSRDGDGKRGASFYWDRILWLATCTSSSLSSLLVQLFQVVLMKLNCESENYTLKSYESKDRESETCKSESCELKAPSDRCGTMSVKEFLGEDGHLSVNGAALCDDCQGTRHLQTRTAAHTQPSRPRRAAGAMGHTFARAGHVLMQTLRRVGAAGGRVSETVRLALQVALVAPGKATSGTFWWLGIGWYQFVTLISWLNVFLLTRCLRHTCKLLILLIPLLLLLGAGLSLWGQGDLLPSLPVVDWMHIYRVQRVEDARDATQLRPPPEDGDEAFHWRGVHDVQTQMAALSGRCQSHDEQLRDLAASLQELQARVDRMHGDSDGMSSLVRSVVGQHLKDLHADGLLRSQADATTAHREHESRISHLEGLLGKLTGRSEAIQEALEQTTLRTARGAEEVRSLLLVVRQLELELGHLQSELSAGQHEGHGCGQVDTQVREAVGHLLSDDQQDGPLESLLQRLSSHFVSKDDLQASLRDLELQILRNVTHHLSAMKQAVSTEAVASAVHGAGVSGITEAQAHVIVNNALKLYSQDKTGMVDFALESGGGSILGTRCSETHETKTALISLFGIPLWYFSQSPRVVIQPDIYPGNCWAFKGSQGYLVVRLSMTIRPTSFTLEHIPKTLSPTGNITSAPKDFSVHGLENEYQEEGQLLGQFTYAQDGESLQTFHVLKRLERAFQIVELRILSNWGHPEYTCLYRFRVHGEPIK